MTESLALPDASRSPADGTAEDKTAVIMQALAKSHTTSSLDAEHRRQEQKADNAVVRNLRLTYANSMLGLLAAQLILMNGVFFLVGSESLKFDEWSLRLFLGGTLLQVFGVVTIITTHLFPKGEAPKPVTSE